MFKAKSKTLPASMFTYNPTHIFIFLTACQLPPPSLLLPPALPQHFLTPFLGPPTDPDVILEIFRVNLIHKLKLFTPSVKSPGWGHELEKEIRVFFLSLVRCI